MNQDFSFKKGKKASRRELVNQIMQQAYISKHLSLGKNNKAQKSYPKNPP